MVLKVSCAQPQRQFVLQGRRQFHSAVRVRTCASAARDSRSDVLLDVNQLQTQLSKAVAAEDFSEAARIRDQLTDVCGDESTARTGWTGLGIPDWLADRAERLGFVMPTEIQHRAIKLFLLGADVLLRAHTGSGKTLAFVMPTLSMLEYPPHVYGEDLKGPQAVIVVPHRELGVQICMLIYRLIGGSVNKGIPGERATMFSYFGPRGVQVRGILDKEEVLRAKAAGYVEGCHIVVGTPDCLAEVMQEPQALEIMQHTKVVVVDEADACVLSHREAMRAVLGAACSQEEKPTLAFVGASIDKDFKEELVRERWLSFPVTLEGSGPGLVPPAIQHRFVVIPEGVARGSVLSKLLRGILEARGEDAPSPRVVAFATDADEADKLATPLRAALWEEYRIGLVLPDGEYPTKILEDFRDCKTSMILLTPELARGLDLPEVSHVFNFDLPETATEYLHRAGRVGRIGSDAGGVMTTLITPEDVPRLQAMAEELGIKARSESVEVSTQAVQAALLGGSGGDGDADGKKAATGEAKGSSEKALDQAKKLLEDLFNLY
eukprot:jgi/Ulvmu1/8671/UM047_0009.1